MIHRALVVVVALSTVAGCAAGTAEKRIVLVPKSQLDSCKVARSSLERKLATARSQVATLQKGMSSEEAERIAAQKHAMSYRNIVDRFARAFGVGTVAVTDRGGLLVVQIPNTILFDFGKANLSEKGEDTVARLAPVLEGMKNITFLVAGNTDDIPVSKKSRAFHSNWELSEKRSLAVLNILVSDGVNPHEVAATGFGEFLPVASNATSEGRAKNRRTEIILLPMIKSNVLALAETAEHNSQDGTYKPATRARKAIPQASSDACGKP